MIDLGVIFELIPSQALQHITNIDDIIIQYIINRTMNSK